VPSVAIVGNFADLLQVFAPCFTEPTFGRFVTLVAGWVLCVGKRTVTGLIRGAGVVGRRHHSGYHRFFSAARWTTDAVGLMLRRMLLAAHGASDVVILAVDDTLARHTGKHIASGAMHRDPLLSTATKPFFHFGHNWVVLAVVVCVPRWNKSFALPVLVRLYRTAKLDKQQGRVHRKKTELAAELIALVASHFPERRFRLVGDNGYTNRAVFRPLPESMHFVGRAVMKAALYAPPVKRQGPQRGRPRVKGQRLPSPAQRAETGRWRSIDALIYGSTATVKVQVFDALWYQAAHGRLLRFVLIRGWPGHDKDDVLVTTDRSLTAAQIIETFCLRWSLEETFGWAKGRLGFEDPHNRTERAVQRTAPMALWTYSLVVHWYLTWSQRRTRLPFRLAPWYGNKTVPSFSDMLATLRRHSWSVWISDLALHDRLDQKHLSPLLDAAGYG
jgi:hypothetical protein